MKKELVFLKMLAARLVFLLALFSACRLIFLLVNRRFFPEKVGSLELGGHFLNGLRFDISSLFWVNGLFIFISLLSFSFRKNGWIRRLQKWLFIVPNLACLAIELADVAWFPFNIRRTIASDFNLLLNTKNLWGRFLLENWWQVGLIFMAGFGLARFFEKTDLLKNQPVNLLKPTMQTIGIHLVIFLFGVGCWVLGARGGWQMLPLTPLAASKFVRDPRWSPLLSNATMNLLVSVQQSFVEEKSWFSEAELDAEYTLRQKFDYQPDEFRQLNVVFIVLESFGRGVQADGFTPFLDSLEKTSFAPKISFANGVRSSQGNAAIMAGIPGLMANSLTISPYQNNRLDGIGKLLSEKSYSTSFFHGSNPGSLQLDKLAASSGFEQLFDRSHFPDQSMYDGQWGIFDRPFLQFFVEKLDSMPQPFCSYFFTLSSHHPFRSEPFFEKRHPEMPRIERSFRYADESLRKFFEKASRKPWFENTLFVIVADHSGPTKKAEFTTFVGKFRVPILFYCPKWLPASQPDRLIQQADILPSVLDFLHFDQQFSSFGTSIFHPDSTRTRFAFVEEAGIFELMDADFLLLFDGQKPLGLFNYPNDTWLEHDLQKEKPALAARFERRLKAIIQRHNQAMIRNQLSE